MLLCEFEGLPLSLSVKWGDGVPKALHGGLCKWLRKIPTEGLQCGARISYRLALVPPFFPEHHRCPEVSPDHLCGGGARLRERDPVQKHGYEIRLLPRGAGPAATGGGSEKHPEGPAHPGHHAEGTPVTHGESSQEMGAWPDRVSGSQGLLAQGLPCCADAVLS